jgi:hypothetical protein
VLRHVSHLHVITLHFNVIGFVMHRISLFILFFVLISFNCNLIFIFLLSAYSSPFQSLFYFCTIPICILLDYFISCICFLISSPCYHFISTSLHTLAVQMRLVSVASRPALGPTLLPLEWIPQPLSPWVKRPGQEADLSPLSSAEVNNCEAIFPLPHTRTPSWCSV